VLGGMMALFAVLGVNLYLAQYLQLVLGLEPLPAALWTLPGMIMLAVGAVTAPRLRDRWGDPRTFAVGFAVAGLGVAVLTLTPVAGGLTLVVVAEVIFGFGVSQVMTIATDLVVAAAPPDRAGAASAISETGNELGAALGVAVLGSLGTALYRFRIGAALPPGTPAADRPEIEATLAGAVAAAPPARGRAGGPGVGRPGVGGGPVGVRHRPGSGRGGRRDDHDRTGGGRTAAGPSAGNRSARRRRRARIGSARR